MNLVEPLHYHASKHPEKIALVEKSGRHQKTLTYRELLNCVENTRNQLSLNGIGSKSRALVMQPIGIDFYVLLLACFSTGTTVVLIDPAVRSEVMTHACNSSQPDIFIGPAKAHLLKLKFSALGKVKQSFSTSTCSLFFKRIALSITSEKKPINPESLNPDHPALITFTSGSTGLPKAACRSHSFLIEQHHALSNALNHDENEVELITLPVFGLASLASGMTTVIADTDLKYPAKANSSRILQQCKQHQITRCAASPAFFKKLHTDQQFPPLKKIYTGGAPVFPALLKELKKHNPELNITTVYGSTEAEPISDQAYEETTPKQWELMSHGKGLLVGKPVPEIQLKIISLNNSSQATELNTGQIGEIIVTGAHVLKGYLKTETNTETKLSINQVTWHRTGDSGYLDESGYLWLTGRTSAILTNSKGEKLYPFCIESIVMSIPHVHSCAVIAFNNEIILCYSGFPKLKELKEKTQSSSIDQYIHVDKIPLDDRHNAKVNYPLLRKLLKNRIAPMLPEEAKALVNGAG